MHRQPLPLPLPLAVNSRRRLQRQARPAPMMTSPAISLTSIPTASTQRGRHPRPETSDGPSGPHQPDADYHLSSYTSTARLKAPAPPLDRADETIYPQPLALALLTLGIGLAAFLVALDRTIVATAIPRITDEFNSPADVGWYGSAYLLTSCAFQPTFGRVFAHFDVRWSFLLALGLFQIGSLICGVAPSSGVLIIGRAIAGLGCAGVFAGCLIIVTLSVPLVKRPIFISLVGSMYVWECAFLPSLFYSSRSRYRVSIPLRFPSSSVSFSCVCSSAISSLVDARFGYVLSLTFRLLACFFPSRNQSICPEAMPATLTPRTDSALVPSAAPS